MIAVVVMGLLTHMPNAVELSLLRERGKRAAVLTLCSESESLETSEALAQLLDTRLVRPGDRLVAFNGQPLEGCAALQTAAKAAIAEGHSSTLRFEPQDPVVRFTASEVLALLRGSV